MFKYVDNQGHTQDVDMTAEELMYAPRAAGQTPQEYVNTKYKDADLAIGSAFHQMQASLGIQRGNEENIFGLRPTSMSALLGGEFSAAGLNTQQNASPYGTSSRAFTVISIIDAIESAVAKDLTTDINSFYNMVGSTLTVNSEHFEQPVVTYSTLGGPEQATAQRVAQGATPPNMAFFSTADRIRRIGAWTIGMTWTDAALKATTLDFVSMTMARYLKIERDARAYRYIDDLFTGNADMIVGSVTPLVSATLDTATTASGVLTHKAWLKFLAHNRKYRRITNVMGDMNAYLAVESRTGRPAANAHDMTLATIDPQARITNQGFGNDVNFFLTDDATDGGPVPANTLYALDRSNAITLVRNSNAAYQAVEQYIMSRTTAMRLDWAEECFRTFGDTDLKPFEALTITTSG